ncbi:MAG: LysM peptidoglycan-binding domain-containing protein [Burkholderiales bacterium]|jgi:pilus assembly protein FimV|nr:LysM peptidoglycan-binding domain-containing protein [Burkholderiales bacterium]
MQKKDIFRLGLLVTALTLSQGVWALGLGKLTVQSALGQSLNAQIELMGTREEFSELTAKIAAPSLYQEKDLVYQAVLTRTKVTLEQRADGSAFLKIVSSQPVAEPYIDLLVEVNWPAGHTLREYTVLLDPPAVGRPEPVVSAQQATVAGRAKARGVTALTVATAPTPTAASPMQRVRPKPTPSRVSGASAEGDNYTVQRGDTLSGIAKTYKPDEITLNQALAALYETNPSAFIGKNMNRLRTGAILQVPNQEEMAATDTRAANRVVRVQVAEWRNYIGEVAGQPVPVRPGSGTTTAEGAITQQTTVVGGVERGQDQLVVSAGSGRGSRGQAAGSAAAEIAALKNAAAEERLALEKALTEEKDRVRALEDTVKKLQRALDLQNEKLAQMQKQAEAAAQSRAAPQPQVEPPKPPEVVPPEVKPEPTQPPVKPSGEVTPQEQVTSTTTEVAPEPPAPPVRPQPRPRPAPPPPPPPPEPSFVDNVLETASENLMLILAGIGVLVLVVGALVFRRRRAEEVAVDSLFGATTTSATTTGGTMSPYSSLSSVGASGGEAVRGPSNATASSNSILSEFSREGLGSIDTGEVDPLAEADVYLAYGRAQQAEEILQDALKRGPDRQDVYLKLLEVYADQKKTTEFEATAQQLHDLTRGKGEYWRRAVDIGRRLLPGNTLFTITGLMDGEITSTNVATEPLQMGGKAVDPRGFAPMESRSIAERAADIANRAVEARGIPTQPPPKDFTFGMESAPAQEDFGVDLDLEELSRFKNYGKAEERVDITETKQQPDIEFNLDDFDSPPQIDAEREPMQRAPSLAELDFSENDSIAEDMSLSVLEGQWHDAATKLDLARAYQATGDAEACREILQEVLQEGDDQQKAEANAILQSLS